LIVFLLFFIIFLSIFIQQMHSIISFQALIIIIIHNKKKKEKEKIVINPVVITANTNFHTIRKTRQWSKLNRKSKKKRKTIKAILTRITRIRFWSKSRTINKHIGCNNKRQSSIIAGISYWAITLHTQEEHCPE